MLNIRVLVGVVVSNFLGAGVAVLLWFLLTSAFGWSFLQNPVFLVLWGLLFGFSAVALFLWRASDGLFT